MSKLEIQRRKRPDHDPPVLLVDSFISDADMKYLDEHGWYALAKEYRERFGKRYPGFSESGVSVKEYMEQLRAVFENEDSDAIIKKHSTPKPVSFDDIAEMLQKNNSR